MRSLLDDLRALVQGIMPATLQERGLHAGVLALADQMPMTVRVDVVGPLDRMDAEVESTGYFVVAEALNNAVKHAGAQEVTVTLAATDGRLEVTVTDDGKGVADATRASACAASRTGSPPWTGRSPCGPRPAGVRRCGRSSYAPDHRRGRRPPPRGDRPHPRGRGVRGGGSGGRPRRSPREGPDASPRRRRDRHPDAAHLHPRRDRGRAADQARAAGHRGDRPSTSTPPALWSCSSSAPSASGTS